MKSVFHVTHENNTEQNKTWDINFQLPFTELEVFSLPCFIVFSIPPKEDQFYTNTQNNHH